MFSAMLMDAYRDERPGVRMAYRTDGHLLNQRPTHFHLRVSKTTVHELPLADDCALNAISEGDTQRRVGLFAAACDNFGLVSNAEKTVVTHQPLPDAVYGTTQINVNGTQLQVVDNFTSLFRITKIDD
nr:unnamed protein product [Spirometra erinaceieuropaei]